MPTFVKRRPDAPRGFFGVEAAGLAWLRSAEGVGGARVVEVVDVDATQIVLQRLVPGTPRGGAVAAAEDLGRRLAATHGAGAPWFGCPPHGWDSDGFIGTIPLPHRQFRSDGDPDSGRSGEDSEAGVDPVTPWGSFFARYRILPFARTARDRGSLTAQGLATLERLCERLADGEADLCGPTEPVARLHGDLWSGNVLWTADGAVLIDPAAHGGHRESDLAMLALFGLPHLDRVLAAYDEAHPLADGWRRRVGVHQLFPLLVHAVLFGNSYGAQAATVAARY